MAAIVTALADLVLGARCAGCGLPALGLCPECRAVLGALRPRRVTRPLDGFPGTVAAGEYADQLRQVLLSAKQRGGLTHLPLLGRLTARAVAALVLAADPPLPLVLVPVPTVASRVRGRGLDLTAALAVRAAGELSWRGLAAQARPLVRLARTPADQIGLDRQQRVANPAGAYRCRAAPERGSVVVIDDVVTTGATLLAVAGALRTAGADPAGAATVAETTRRGDQKAPASVTEPVG